MHWKSIPKKPIVWKDVTRSLVKVIDGSTACFNIEVNTNKAASLSHINICCFIDTMTGEDEQAGGRILVIT